MPPIVVALIMVVNAGYGGGFSNVPTLLSDEFGISLSYRCTQIG